MRSRLIVIIAVLVFTGLNVQGSNAESALIGSWTPTAQMTSMRSSHTATLLPNGKVLVTGGVGANPESFFSTEIYDPVSNQWSQGAIMNEPRVQHAATLLNTGQVLIIGRLAERFDPATNKTTPTGPMVSRRTSVPATTLLPDGRVLVTGGSDRTGAGGGPLAAAELYDPRNNTWAAAAPMSSARFDNTATLLPNGQVFVIGSEGTAERYDPASNRWLPAAPMSRPRASHTATLLPDGRVLVSGGLISQALATATAEIYDPATDRWVPAASMTNARRYHQSVLLNSGHVLVMGGYDPNSKGNAAVGNSRGNLFTAETYDPRTDRWEAALNMGDARSGHTATLISTGHVLVAGGADGSTAEVYSPDGRPPACYAPTGKCTESRFHAYWEAHGGLSINGYPISDPFMETLENGRPYLVQYFERVRMEYHPEVADPQYQIQLGQFGRKLHPADPPVSESPGITYFKETGHNVPPDLIAYWQAHGGLAQFGFPLSEVFRETLEDGKQYEVQYFERARFERHPENAPPNDIQLGQFGRRVLAGR